ncbi:hydrolase, alpha/beta domain protein [Aeromicrobium marinum DSM 15272]|uniref:Hydrolase, alpha/beta domain protein n=1 Tax=Aeromicrobium marinum DSM 15272 TaxID=585531 RepID=E2SFX7_9ACTN|nr:alpha/beta fold hydrolase [Aeromicrobium marinum]EFQ81924.1 hydrolase, alpha/beta domain protein [Aeromicrobium marinum DSM 15272]
MSITSVRSGDVRLAVHESGPSDAPVIIAVHGYPDTSAVWNQVVPLLDDTFRVVTYDVRGTGGSSAPRGRAAYATRHLVDDLAAVVEAVAPGRTVHLLGHDWGSVQLWDAVLTEADHPRLRGRIASFTSVSGPALELVGHFLASSARRRQYLPLARQLAKSWYVMVFQLPVLPELVLTALGQRLPRILAGGQDLQDSHWGETFVEDARRGVNLYRANSPRFTPASTRVPVQLVVPTRDAFLSPAIYADVATFAPDLRRLDVVADHWIPQAQPDVVADAVRTWVDDVEARQSRAG